MLRRIFNQGDHVRRAARGEIRMVVVDQRPAPASAGQVPGTMSQFIHFRTRDGRLLAMAFCYRRPDGSVGGSGKLDPKWLLHRGRLLIPFRIQKGQRCPGCGRTHR